VLSRRLSALMTMSVIGAWGVRGYGEKNLSVTDVVTANFNKIYWIVFNYFKNNPVRIAYRERVILFEIPLQSMGLKSFIEDVFLKDSKALS
jgi:hypothetical protein